MTTSPSVATSAAPARSLLSAVEAFFSMQRESATMRFVARGIIATWLLPVFFALFASLQMPAAQAQGAPASSVIVLDFSTPNGTDPLLGRKAADGLAVELQRSGSYDVVPRQRIEEAVNDQAGLQPPYNDIAQIKLAETVNANSVFSGRIINVDVSQGRSARVTLEARQLDVITGDFINGTVVSESTEQKLGVVQNEILIDEAINKAVFAAVRSMRQTTLPTGTVLNVAPNEVVLSIGADAGVAPGQKFSVLRDKYDRARNVTERRKIGEVTVFNVNATQSSARISAGGREGVATQDRVRQIFTPANYPVTASRGGSSVTPVTAPVGRQAGGGVGGFVRKSQAGLLGLVGLAALVSLVGFGGGTGTNPPRPLTITEANPTQTFPQPRFNFEAGFDGINFSQTLDRESVVAYLVYRGTAPGFTPDITNLQAVVDARFDASSRNITFTDSGIQGRSPLRVIEITSTTTGGGNTGTTGGTTGNASGTGSINFSSRDVTTTTGIGNDSIVVTPAQITINFTQRPFEIGQTYFYRVGRITAQRQRSTNTGNNNNGNQGNQAQNTTTVTLLPVRSPISDSIGGYTPLFRPEIVPGQTFNTDNFSVRINTDFSSFFRDVIEFDPVTGDIVGQPMIDLGFGYETPSPGNFFVGAGVNQFRFEVSTSQAFPRNATFISPDIPNPGFNGVANDITLSLGAGSDIRIPSSPTNPYIPGVTPLFIRVLSRNTNDINPTFRVSPTVRIDSAQGQNRTKTSRFLGDAPSGGANEGFNLGRPGSLSGRSAPQTSAPRAGIPR